MVNYNRYIEQYVTVPHRQYIKQHTSADELATFVDSYAVPIQDCVMIDGVPTVVESHLLEFIMPIYLVLQYERNREMLVSQCLLDVNHLNEAMEILNECEEKLRLTGVEGFNHWWSMEGQDKIQVLFSRLSKLEFQMVDEVYNA